VVGVLGCLFGFGFGGGAGGGGLSSSASLSRATMRQGCGLGRCLSPRPRIVLLQRLSLSLRLSLLLGLFIGLSLRLRLRLRFSCGLSCAGSGLVAAALRCFGFGLLLLAFGGGAGLIGLALPLSFGASVLGPNLTFGFFHTLTQGFNLALSQPFGFAWGGTALICRGDSWRYDRNRNPPWNGYRRNQIIGGLGGAIRPRAPPTWGRRRAGDWHWRGSRCHHRCCYYRGNRRCHHRVASWRRRATRTAALPGFKPAPRGAAFIVLADQVAR
jgi:hypothetical protein